MAGRVLRAVPQRISPKKNNTSLLEDLRQISEEIPPVNLTVFI